MARYKWNSFIILLLTLVSMTLYGFTIPPKPNRAIYVHDLANILSESQRSDLESMLIQYYDSTSTQIVVVTTPSLEGGDASQYATELGEKWGIGQKAQDNGVVFLVAPNERKMFIATGYGSEAKLTDAFLSRLRDNYILPEFKRGDYYSGIRMGIVQMIHRLQGEFQNEKSNTSEETIDIGFREWLIIFLIIILFLWIISRVAKSSNYSETYNGRGYRRGPFDGGFWGGGFGGGSFGGDSWGSGGGFGGGSFGGGSFGGGGSGGSW